jgi:hypothetical protein
MAAWSQVPNIYRLRRLQQLINTVLETLPNFFIIRLIALAF